jgi:hypothetical protein
MVPGLAAGDCGATKQIDLKLLPHVWFSAATRRHFGYRTSEGGLAVIKPAG